MYDYIEVVGDDIFFGHWRVGRLPDDMPATIRDNLAYLLERPPTEEIENELRDAHKSEIEGLQEDCENLETRVQELQDELTDARNDLAGYEADEKSYLMKLKARLRSKMK